MTQEEKERTGEAAAAQQEQAAPEPAEASVADAAATGEASGVQGEAGAPSEPPSEQKAVAAGTAERDDQPAGPPQEGPGAERQERPRPERRRRFGRRKICAFCVEKVQVIDYKDPAKLRRYVSDRGRIEARRRTGTCAKHQRWLSVALKRARHLALLPYTPEHVRLSGAFAPRR